MRARHCLGRFLPAACRRPLWAPPPLHSTLSARARNPAEKRQAEAARIRDKYPDRIPVIVERADKTAIPDIDKKKWVLAHEWGPVGVGGGAAWSAACRLERLPAHLVPHRAPGARLATPPPPPPRPRLALAGTLCLPT